MAWSYSGNPADSDLDAVRFYLGDTDPDRVLLQDEEIEFILAKWMPLNDSTVFAAAEAAEVVSGHFAREVSVSADGVSVAVSELQNKYEQLATALRDQYRSEQQSRPIVSGTMWDEAPDPSIKPLRFGIGFMDNIWAGQQDYGDQSPTDRPQYPEQPGGM